MQVLSSCFVASSVSSSMPTPSSTDAIIAARFLISSCVPPSMAARMSRDSGWARASNIIFRAGLSFATCSRGSMLGRLGNVIPLYRSLWRSGSV